MANGFHPRLETDPVWWNGSNINSFTTASSVGIRTVTLYGWDDRPDVRDVRESRPGQDGEYADNLYLGGRTITIEGEVYGSSWVDLQARKRALAAVVQPSSAEVLLKVPDPATASPTAVYASTGMTGYERVSARVVEAIQFGETMDPLCQTWQVIARASDPRVYSDVETSTDSGTTGTAARTVTVDQTGTYATPPTLTVTGPAASDWTVAEPTSGLSLAFTGLALSSTNTVAIDTKDRTVVASGLYSSSRVFDTTAPAAGLWMLGETSGTTADNIQGTSARDGTYTGGFTLNQTGPFTGYPGVALNGSTGYVSIPDQAALYSAYTVFEGWIYFSSLTGTQTIVDCLSATRGMKVDWDGSTFRVSAGTSTGILVTSASLTHGSISTGLWYRVTAGSAFTTEPGYAGITYIDVRNVSGTVIHSRVSKITDTPRIPTSGGYRFGATLAGASFFNGRISGFGLYPTTNDTGAVYAYVRDQFSADMTGTASIYSYLDAASATWAPLGTASSTYQMNSSGLGSGSKLNVAYRDARL